MEWNSFVTVADPALVLGWLQVKEVDGVDLKITDNAKLIKCIIILCNVFRNTVLIWCSTQIYRFAKNDISGYKNKRRNL
jgi:hypothetical protein